MKTKKNLLILICILSGFFSASAQKPAHYAGIKAGISIPNLTNGVKTSPLSDDVNVTPDTRRFNLGGQGIAGFEVAILSGKLFIEGGGNYGFIPIQKNQENGTNHTGAGTVTVGYLHQLFF